MQLEVQEGEEELSRETPTPPNKKAQQPGGAPPSSSTEMWGEAGSLPARFLLASAQ